jgi:uncharacterized protein
MKAARRGKMEAQFNVGFFYKEGQLVRRDYKKATYWYKLAAIQGDTEAQRDFRVLLHLRTGRKEGSFKSRLLVQEGCRQRRRQSNV